MLSPVHLREKAAEIRKAALASADDSAVMRLMGIAEGFVRLADKMDAHRPGAPDQRPRTSRPRDRS